MILYVLRHGITEDAAVGGDDRSRPLAPRGRARLRAAAAGMLRLGFRLDALLTSPLVRARETATIVAAAYGTEPAPRELGALAAGVPAEETLRALRPFAPHAAVMIVGHKPGLGELVALLLTGSSAGMAVVLKKGGLVVLDVEHVAPHGAALRCMLTPRQLRRFGG